MTYEHRCKECGRAFDITASIAEKEAGLRPACPGCGSKKTAQVFGAIGILSAARASSSGGFGGSPSHNQGGGCCG